MVGMLGSGVGGRWRSIGQSNAEKGRVEVRSVGNWRPRPLGIGHCTDRVPAHPRIALDFARPDDVDLANWRPHLGREARPRYQRLHSLENVD